MKFFAAWLVVVAPLLMANGDCEPGHGALQTASQHFKGNAICSWFDDSRNNHEIICISEGRRYSCLVSGNNHVECATTALPAPAEAPRPPKDNQ